MEKKSVLIGISALIMSTILTLVLVTLVIDPFSYGVYAPDAFLTSEEKTERSRLDSLRKDSIRIDLINKENIRIAQLRKDSIIRDSITQDSLRRVKLVESVYIYNKLNYTLSTISTKREELLLRDSIQKIWKVADNYKTRGDSISGFISSGDKTIDSLKKIVLDLNKKVEQSQEKVAGLQKDLAESQKDLQKALEVPPPPPIEYTEEQVLGYSKAYESMEPSVAAKHIELMHEDDALEILTNLQPRAVGRILGEMEPTKAAKIWLNLSSKKEK
jgi:flagellar motility protein MotE (MotC chaperone)